MKCKFKPKQSRSFNPTLWINSNNFIDNNEVAQNIQPSILMFIKATMGISIKKPKQLVPAFLKRNYNVIAYKRFFFPFCLLSGPLKLVAFTPALVPFSNFCAKAGVPTKKIRGNEILFHFIFLVFNIHDDVKI